MFKRFRDKIAVSGIVVLAVGIALLVFTFVSAYGFLTAGLSIVTSADLTQTFGEALGPLIGTCIRIMYLGVMGWIGSLITIRGVTILTHFPQAQNISAQSTMGEKASTTLSAQPKQQLQTIQEKTMKPSIVPEPEIVVTLPDQEKQPSHEPVQTQAQWGNRQNKQDIN